MSFTGLKAGKEKSYRMEAGIIAAVRGPEKTARIRLRRLPSANFIAFFLNAIIAGGGNQ